jgi:hypothetical protein
MLPISCDARDQHGCTPPDEQKQWEPAANWKLAEAPAQAVIERVAKSLKLE